MAEKDAPKRDFRQDLTNQIIDLIEQGTAPWQKPWDANEASAALQMPYNAATGRAYRGGNALWLMAKGQGQFDSNDPRWCTYNQAKEKGWQVKAGSKGTQVEYWEFDRDEWRTGADGKREKVKVKLDRPRVFYATVFHASQIDKIPELSARERADGWSPVEAAEAILKGSGAQIYHDQQDRAFYSPARDSIHLPPREAFPQALDYYEVAMHELGHWTGHPDRLKRDLSGNFGSASYAQEELRAQMASLYLSAELGVPFNPDRHAAYQASWVEVLKKDKHELFRAAKDAEEIADYVIDLARERKLTKDIEADPAQPAATSELEQLKTEHMGKAAKLEFAADNGGRVVFEGPIIAETGEYIIQRVNDETAVVHAKTNLQQDVEVGDNLSITYEHGKVYAHELGADKERERQAHDVEAQGVSAENAREEIRKRFGNDIKFVEPDDTERGNYAGAVVAQDAREVIQRLGANKFVAHSRNAVEKPDELQPNKFVKLQYEKGRAQVQGNERQQQRARGPERELVR